jgi:transcription initiation factor IIF auxiliary subunit
VGWGEFEIQIKIYFKEEEYQPLEVFHQLKVNDIDIILSFIRIK